MNFHPDHPASEQAFTTFRVPARLSLLVVVACAVVVATVWDAVTAAGSWMDAPGPIRSAVVACAAFLAVRSLVAARNRRRRGLGPDIERIT